MKYMKIIELVLPNMWLVMYEVLATDNFVFAKSAIEADSAEEALEIFNKKIADDHYIKKTTIDNVRSFKYYRRK